jgi:hypothetical protein
MKRRLYIHLGPSKTGTSAIQGFFRDYGVTSILYPETGRWPDGSHHKLVFAHQGKTKYGLIEVPAWGPLCQQLDKEISSSDKDVLISSELSTLAFVKALISLLSKHDFDIRLILTIRNPLERAASAYNQNVKDEAIGLTENPDEFLLKSKMDFNFKALYEKWSMLNLPLIIIPYKDEIPLTQRFCLAIGACVDVFRNEEYPNRSMGGPALIAVLIANKLLNNETQRRAFFTQLREDKSFGVWKGNSFPFSERACNDFCNAVKPDIEWVVAKFGFTKATLNTIEKTLFSLSVRDIQNIHIHLEKAGLAEKNTQLITKTLGPFCIKNKMNS